MFYTYSQNNSGGSFSFDKRDGITHMVIIEAENHHEANSKAESVGLYFDGSGDCPCCGNRWDEIDKSDGKNKPEVYGKSPKDFVKDGSTLWMKKGFEVCVHYKDGRKEWF